MFVKNNFTGTNLVDVPQSDRVAESSHGKARISSGSAAIDPRQKKPFCTAKITGVSSAKIDTSKTFRTSEIPGP
ncbi:hypothetical protein JTE90_017874 [Oedothorax gibbosus]|uniref:Uncharacterized protein n=1 Tax=Oedothorax gibbosus TaxID=931172 RepID=A0AAV6V420_9ARAC|nr:hypothetical protein JTE90_017874 [Oedothorax gibbosus]